MADFRLVRGGHWTAVAVIVAAVAVGLSVARIARPSPAEYAVGGAASYFRTAQRRTGLDANVWKVGYAPRRPPRGGKGPNKQRPSKFATTTRKQVTTTDSFDYFEHIQFTPGRQWIDNDVVDKTL